MPAASGKINPEGEAQAPAPAPGCLGKVKQACVDIYHKFDLADIYLDPYVKVTLVPWMVSKRTDDFDDMKDEAVWNETLEFDYEGGKLGRLFVEVWDEDVGADDLIGTGTVDLHEMFKNASQKVEHKVELSDSGLNDCGILELKLLFEPSAGAGADQTKNGLAPGKLSVIVEKGTGLKNFAKELHKIEDDKTLWVMAILTTVFYFLLSGIVYTNVEPIVPGGDAVPCPDGSWCLDSSGANSTDGNCYDTDWNDGNATAIATCSGEVAWTWTDAVYFSVCSLTTVGYGDLFPQTDEGKIFTCVYVYFGIGIISAALGYLINVMLDSASSEADDMLAKAGGSEAQKKLKRDKKIKKYTKSVLLVLLSILIGSIFYAFVFDIGSEREGAEKFLDAFYMTCITMTSVGYGDYSPQTQGGRLFGIFWILFGTLVVVNLASDLADTFLQAKQEQINRRIMAKSLRSKDLLQLDQDKSGQISELEYLEHMLVKLRLAETKQIQELRDRFKELDKSGDGIISKEDFEAAGL
jgi:potassium channel subfamily K